MMRVDVHKCVSLPLLILFALALNTAVSAGPGTPYDSPISREKADLFRKSGSIGNCSPGHADKYLDINNVRARILNIGGLFWNGAPNVYEVPVDTGNMSLFNTGFWVGGHVNGELRVAAARYGAWEFWPGPLDENGNPPGQSPSLLGSCNDYDRIYKVSREDVRVLDRTGVISADIADWPYELGAPVWDRDGDPTNYNIQGGDRPQVTGDQMLWWVMNDMGNVHEATQTRNIGLEVRVTAFAFNRAGHLGNVTFYTYKLVYRGDEPMHNTYVAFWADPDLGDAGDDFVGSDPDLGLGYVYNADNFDATYGDAPPALGFDFLRGPLVDTDGDGSLERLGMTGFISLVNGSSLLGDPGVGKEYYNNMSCRLKNGESLTVGGNGTTGTEPTCFAYSGDPVTGKGWSEENTDGFGRPNQGGDRRFVMSTGPFTLNPGETQELIIATLWAQGTDRLNSINLLRAASINVQLIDEFVPPPLLDAPQVHVSHGNGEAFLTWGNDPGGNNYLNSFYDDCLGYSLEGYLVYRYDSTEDSNPEVVAVYDKANGIKNIYSRPMTDYLSITLEVQGRDSGIQNFHRIGDLTNYTRYLFGVQAYAYSSTVFGYRSVIYSPVSKVAFIPTDASKENGGTYIPAKFGSELTSRSIGEPSDGYATATVANPVAITGHDYYITFRSVVARGETFIVYDILDATTGDAKFNGDDYLNETRRAPPQPDAGSELVVPIIIDGLQFYIYGPPTNMVKALKRTRSLCSLRPDLPRKRA